MLKKERATGQIEERKKWRTGIGRKARERFKKERGGNR
jgi:hypothetical protein